MAGFEYIRCATVQVNGCNDAWLDDAETLLFDSIEASCLPHLHLDLFMFHCVTHTPHARTRPCREAALRAYGQWASVDKQNVDHAAALVGLCEDGGNDSILSGI